jgi:hypothetical protein
MASPLMRVPETVHAHAKEVAKERDMSMKEALRHMCRGDGIDV